MEKGDHRDQERPSRATTRRELEGRKEIMKCVDCDAVGIYWNEKRNLYYCGAHRPRKPIAEEFALKPIPRDKGHIYSFSSRAKNPKTAARFHEMLRKKGRVK